MTDDPEGVEVAKALIKSLEGSNWTQTSPRNRSYNCFAWAAREFNHWVEPPGTAPWTSWPDGLPDFDTVGTYVALYERVGFSRCDDGALVEGVEKIAIFADPVGSPLHAARQLPSGRWTSKFGKGIDFEHDLETINGDPAVGSIAQFMQRPFESPLPDPPAGLLLPDEDGEIPACIFD